MTFDGGRWTLTREDPDMHQRSLRTSRRTGSTVAGRLPRTRARPGARTTSSPSSGAPKTRRQRAGRVPGRSCRRS
jgi:hypothetical protein